MTQFGMRWRTFGQQILTRIAIHFCLLLLVWCLVILFRQYQSAGFLMSFFAVRDSVAATFYSLMESLWSGTLSVLIVSLLWAALGFASSLRVSLTISLFATGIAALNSSYAAPSFAPGWLSFAGARTASFLQLGAALALTLSSAYALIRRLVVRYETITGDDRLALSPEEEDYANRDLVQSLFKLVLVLFCLFGLWVIANVRPSPVVASADPREQRPSVLLLATHSDEALNVMRKKLGSAQFSSWVVFGSPRTISKFDEILQCRYPIRLTGKSSLVPSRGQAAVQDTLVPLALSSVGYSVNLMHASDGKGIGLPLQMWSRAYAHLKLFRRLGLLSPSRVYHTTDVQLAQIREALSSAVQRGEPAFISSALRTGRSPQFSHTEQQEFQMFLDGLETQGWLEKIMFIAMELPNHQLQDEQLDLSLQSTTARVSIWMPRAMADLKLTTASTNLIRGIDIGASITARLSPSSLLTQCDGATLFDLSERPSLFPRELVYQEFETNNKRSLFRKRGWLSSDGYRLEVNETYEGVTVEAFKFSMQQLLQRTMADAIEELPLQEETVIKELNRQLDEFLRGAGVEVLPLGNGRIGYSEPLRKVKFLTQ